MSSRIHQLKGGLVALIGYILSPLSWWNDLFVNIPIAYLMAWPFAHFEPALLLPAMVVGYWLTNIAGLVMLHRGSAGLIRRKTDEQVGRHQFAQDLILSSLYTILIVILIETGILVTPSELLKQVL